MSDHKRPETIPGYVHPNGPSNYSRKGGGVYKTFTEGEEASDTETFSSTCVETHYAVQGGTEQEDGDTCPQCKGPSVSVCPCAYSDKTCGKGHVWYTDRSGSTRNGNPHKK